MNSWRRWLIFLGWEACSAQGPPTVAMAVPSFWAQAPRWV
jgi:hypothetical protein